MRPPTPEAAPPAFLVRTAAAPLYFVTKHLERIWFAMDEHEPVDVVAEIDRLFPSVFRVLQVRHRRALACGVTPPMLLLLRRLAATQGASTVSELAHRVSLAPSTVSPMLKRLERRGLVHRERDPTDERRVIVVLTGEGRRLASRSTPDADAGLLVEALQRLTHPEREVLLRALQRLLEAARAPKIEA